MNLSRRLLPVLMMALACAATPALADWVVTRISPPASYAVDGRSWLPLVMGAKVPEGAWVRTGRTGRLLLQEDGETLQFKPNTVAAISRVIEDGREVTTVRHKFGVILVDRDPKARHSTVVETPYLAAIVKGTKFEVEVRLEMARVRVFEGVVTVIHRALGRQASVQAGQVAVAQGQRRFAVRGGEESATIAVMEPREPKVNAARSERASRNFGADRGTSDAEFLREEKERAAEEERRRERVEHRTPPGAGAGEDPPPRDAGGKPAPGAGAGRDPQPGGNPGSRPGDNPRSRPGESPNPRPGEGPEPGMEPDPSSPPGGDQDPSSPPGGAGQSPAPPADGGSTGPDSVDTPDADPSADGAREGSAERSHRP